MPELPEVECFRLVLHSVLENHSVTKLVQYRNDILTLHSPHPPQFPLKFTDSSRIGKNLFLEFNDQHYLAVHFRMTGHFLMKNSGDKPVPHTHLSLYLDHGFRLDYVDPRRFGRLRWFDDKDQLHACLLENLGPDALDLPEELFVSQIRDRNRMIKTLLLDQTVIAGLGNIYTDECLHRARIHPLTPSSQISVKKLKVLWAATQTILHEAIRKGGSTIADFLKPDGSEGKYQDDFQVYAREGEYCFNCRGKIRRIVVAQRGTWICSRCQKLS